MQNIIENMIMIKKSDRSEFERLLCKIPTSKIIGQPKTIKTKDHYLYSALVRMTPEEIEKLIKE